MRLLCKLPSLRNRFQRFYDIAIYYPFYFKLSIFKIFLHRMYAANYRIRLKTCFSKLSGRQQAGTAIFTIKDINLPSGKSAHPCIRILVWPVNCSFIMIFPILLRLSDINHNRLLTILQHTDFIWMYCIKSHLSILPYKIIHCLFLPSPDKGVHGRKKGTDYKFFCNLFPFTSYASFSVSLQSAVSRFCCSKSYWKSC